MREKYDLIIVGGGAAGLAAALYAGRYRLKTLLLSRDLGGETTIAGTIENYPGILSIEGHELMQTMQAQAKKGGAKLLQADVKKMSRQKDCFLIQTPKATFQAATVILAIGAGRRKLNLPREEELTGKGVHYCALCDGPLYGGKIVAVVGSGDSAVKEANFLADYAKKVFLIARSQSSKAEPITWERAESKGPKIEKLFGTEVKALIGKNHLEKILLSKPYRGSRELKLDALFIEIGYQPYRDFLRPLKVKLDQEGYLAVDALMRTKVPGLLAAGDMTNHFGHFKQDITAAAMGAVAATSAYEYLKGQDSFCREHAKPLT